MSEQQWQNLDDKKLAEPTAQPNTSTNEQSQSQAEEGSKEWRLISTLVKDIQQEQKRSRRWGILFKSLTFAFLFSVMFGAWQGVDDKVIGSSTEHVAIVEVFGPIMSGAPASSSELLPSIQAAFEENLAKAIILDVDSPGGSPVHAGIVYDEIIRLKAQYPNKKVYAVIGDVGASGAYYIAAAADYIYADKASIVGSIGVIGSGFGFTDLMDKVGIERRSYTAGNNKDFLDPFQAEKPAQKAQFEALLKEVHEQFVSVVMEGRGERLKAHPDLFSGAVWNGATAKELGLVDGLGSVYSVVRDVIGLREIETYRPAMTPMEELLDQMGAQASTRLQAWLQTPVLR